MTKELLGRVHRELLDVLNSINQDKIHHDGDDFHELLNDVEKALAEHAMSEVQRLGQEIEQEPVAQVLRKALAWGKVYGAVLSGEQWDEMREEMVAQFSIRITTPPQRTWVGLTNQERSECWETIPERAMKKVEAKLKEKNQ